MLFKLACNAHICAYIYVCTSCVSVTWSASLLVMIPHPFWRVEEEPTCPFSAYPSQECCVQVVGKGSAARAGTFGCPCWGAWVLLAKGSRAGVTLGQPGLHQILCRDGAGPITGCCPASSGLCWRSSLTYKEPLPLLPDSAGAVGCFLALESVEAEGCK